MPERMQPPTSGPRFTVGLLSDVAKVLERHGYGPLSGQDLAHLQGVLFALLYSVPPIRARIRDL